MLLLNKKILPLNKNYFNYHNKYYYKYADRRDRLLIRFFCKYGFFNSRLFPDCIYCGERNSRTHIINNCKEEFFANLIKLLLISRLTYGMYIFLDDKRIMESVETARLKYFRSILGIKNNVSNNLIRLVLC